MAAHDDKVTLVSRISAMTEAYKNCLNSGNETWRARWMHALDVARDELPSGSGFDSTPEIDLDRTNATRVVIHGGYHPMNEHGYYMSWRDFTITATAAFDGIDVKCRGAGEHNDYIAEVYYESLRGVYNRNWFINQVAAKGY